MKNEPMKTLTVSVSAEQLERLHSAVASGEYESGSEVVSEALRLWEIENQRRSTIANLKQAYDEGIASGPGRELDAKALLAELKAEARGRG